MEKFNVTTNTSIVFFFFFFNVATFEIFIENEVEQLLIGAELLQIGNRGIFITKQNFSLSLA